MKPLPDLDEDYTFFKHVRFPLNMHTTCKQNQWGCPMSPHMVEQDVCTSVRSIATFMGRH